MHQTDTKISTLRCGWVIGIRGFSHMVNEAMCEQTLAQWERHRDKLEAKGHRMLGRGERSEGSLVLMSHVNGSDQGTSDYKLSTSMCGKFSVLF